MTGHTGFKGGWLTAWLLHRGASVRGYSLGPPTSPALFEQLDLRRRVEGVHADIGDLHALTKAVTDWQPDFVFHLAAQSLVRRSYDDPIETFRVNTLGTVNVLEALRAYGQSCVAIIVTSDKCYRNEEWLYGYRENDPLGGSDPYSSSKAMAELSIASYRDSFFTNGTVGLASVRAGNVIGGGDWAKDRIVPDAIRALSADQPIAVRNPKSRRPWQHVLEPLHGYLRLAATIDTASGSRRTELCSPFNFGPAVASNRTVAELTNTILRYWPRASGADKLGWLDRSDSHAAHEANLLHLASDKSHHLLQWNGVWNFEDSVRETVSWYHRVNAGEDAMTVTREQIHRYEDTVCSSLQTN